MSNADWIELVAPARQGDVASVEQLELKLAPYAHCALLARASHQVAASLVTQALAQVLFRLHLVTRDAQVGLKVAEAARVMAREAAKAPGATVEQASPDPLITQGRRILGKVRELPEVQRERLLLRLLEGVPGFEIAEVLGVSEAEVRGDLERGAAALVKSLGGGDVAFAGDSYLWQLAGPPPPSLIPLENQLTSLRFILAGHADVDQTPSSNRAATSLGVEGLRPVGRRPTGDQPAQLALAPPAQLGDAPDDTSPSQHAVGSGAFVGEGDDRTATVAPPSQGLTRPPQRAGQEPGVSGGTAVKTIGVANLPAEASFDTGIATAPGRDDAAMPTAGLAGSTATGPATEGQVPPRLRSTGPSKPLVPMVGTATAAPQSTASVTASLPEEPSPGAGRNRASGPRRPSAGLGVEPRPLPVNQTALAPMELDPSLLNPSAEPLLDSPPTRQVPSRPMPPLVPEALDAGPTGAQAAEPREARSAARPVSVLSRGSEKATPQARAQAPVPDWHQSDAVAPPPRKAPTKSSGPTRGAAPFVIAAALALVSGGVIALLLSGTSNAVKRGWTLVPVVVANQDMPEGARMTAEAVSTRAVPEQFVTSSVVRPDSVSYVVDQELLVPVQAGDPLLWSQFETAKTTLRLATRIQKHARAISIDVVGSANVGGWVQPNDHVDVICSIKDPEDPLKTRAVTLLQNVVVLTTGKLSPLTSPLMVNPSLRQYHNVGLLLIPEEAEMLTLAGEVGTLLLTLRHEEDVELRQQGLVTTSDTLLDGRRVRMLEKKRLETIQLIRSTAAPKD